MEKFFWIRPISATRYLWVALAILIKENLRLQPLFIVTSEQDKSFYLRAGDGNFSEENFLIEPNFYLMAFRNHQPQEDVFKEMNNFERKYDFTVYRDIIQGDRHIGKSWAWAWNGKPESKSMSKTSRKSALEICLEALKYYEILYKKRPPQFVIGAGLGTGLVGKPISLICKKNCVPLRSMQSARFNNYAYWATDEFGNNSKICSEIKLFENGKVSLNPIKSDKFEESEHFKNFYSSHSKNSKSIFSALKSACLTLLKRQYAVMRGIERTKTGYYATSLASMPLRQWLIERQYKSELFKDINSLPSANKYFLFPLQFEFEASLQGEAPLAPPIFTVIHQISLSLPAGALLLIKEHPLQAGRRPKFIFDLIKGLHNVCLIKPTIHPISIFAKIDAVIQVNSSLGYEALAHGIPVFSLSPHGIIQGSSLNELINKPEEYKKLKRFCLDETQINKNERKHLAIAFESAIRENCFELPNPTKSFSSPLTPNEVRDIVAHLVQSL